MNFDGQMPIDERAKRALLLAHEAVGPEIRQCLGQVGSMWWFRMVTIQCPSLMVGLGWSLSCEYDEESGTMNARVPIMN